MDFFSGMLANSLTPITLISGVGLMLLCMVARYNHTTDRIRQLLARREVGDYENEPDIDREIHLIFRRAKYLRRAMLCLVLSDVCSGLLVATNVFAHLSDLNFVFASSIWLGSALALIVASTAYFSLEVRVSLHALRMAIEHLPGKSPLPMD
ncbi:DUF2721 domain-containing protein [Sutterella seckii]|uniref:DUF2721 domain-containing protein n=1 Tax=Sutterella seckii TaxID=1944635 RepID=A0A6I1ESX7_9BURK|nr:DUF2721 domain-containing protein [Sutterella seckii]KAB7662491.1 DUF2721 domain-containing protein [Sutterella seckii]